MTAFVNGQPVANLTQANTWGEWVSMSNQLILDGIKESANIANAMIGSDIILSLTSRADLGVDTTDSPNFGGVTLSWSNIANLDQSLGTNNSVEFDRVLFTGNLQISTSDQQANARLYVHESDGNGVFVRIGNTVSISEQAEIIEDSTYARRVFISRFVNYIYGKFGVGTQTPNNNFEIVGNFNSSLIEDSGNRVYSDSNKVPKSVIGRGNVPNTTQVPRSGGTFTGTIQIQGTSNINELRVSNNPVQLGAQIANGVHRAVI